MTSIFSVVCVIGRQDEEYPQAIARLREVVQGLRRPAELIAVLNTGDAADVHTLRALSGRYGLLRVYAMKHRVDYETAFLAGVENAIGDWVATIDISVDEPEVIRAPVMERSLVVAIDTSWVRAR